MLVGRLWHRQSARSSRVSTCLFGGWRGRFFCRGRRVARERFFPVIEIGFSIDRQIACHAISKVSKRTSKYRVNEYTT